MSPRVLIADDDALVRSALHTILTAQGVEVVAQVSDGDEIVAAVQAHRPDVVLTDLRMARMSGVDAARELRRMADPPPVVVLTSFGSEQAVLDAVAAGAAGFLAKDAGPEDIARAVRAAADGGAAMDPRSLRYVLDRMNADATAPTHRAAEALEVLTDREREVAGAVARGMSNAQIAAVTYCSETTVKTHISRALTKLELANRVQLALLVARAGAATG